MSGASKDLELATLGGGCFWCLEAVFEQLKGVERVDSGYAGGNMPNPNYQDVCSGQTGHAEVVQITFDPSKVSFEDILNVFFAFHDPTTPNRQGPDIGTQYRSAVFYHSPQQKETAQRRIAELNKERIWTNPIVTELAPLKDFYKAESYHQGYYRQNPEKGYCQAMIGPKVAKLRKQFSAKLKG
jgi:peptide-methionine (S)-S-oxide reductase